MNTMKNSLPKTRSTDVATYSFATRDAAWMFMRACDTAGLSAGFPSLRTYTVEVGIRNRMDRETADALANGAAVVAYAFKGSEIVYS